MCNNKNEKQLRGKANNEQVDSLVTSIKTLKWSQLSQQINPKLAEQILLDPVQFIKMATASTTPPPLLDPSTIESLIDMGFPRDVTTQALMETNGNLEQALERLLASV